MDSRLSLTRRVDASTGLFLVLLVLVAVPKLMLTAAEHGTSVDGGFYTDVALHVAAGNGLQTDVSLYHHGYGTFPHPTAIYPLWPLLYGAAASVFPAPEVGSWLATICFLASLVFAYLWGQRLHPEPLWPAVAPGVGAGHVAAAALGLHQDYFEFTSLPYTEGLAWALLMAALWRLHGRFGAPSLAGGIEAGIWCGLLFLTRSQMIFLVAALLGAKGWLALVDAPRRGRWVLMAGGAGLSFVAVLLPQYLYVETFVVGSPWVAMLRFDAAGVTTELSAVQMLVTTDGPLDWLVDRSRGFLEAFKWGGKYGYRKAFHWFHWAAPAALLVVLLRVRRWPEDARRVLAWLRDPSHAPWVLALAVAVVGFLSIHAIHKSYYMAWNFTRRQGLTSVFLFVLAIVFLARQRHAAPRFFALFLVLNGVGTGYAKVLDGAIRASDRERRPYKLDWRRYLESERGAGTLVVACTGQQGQQLAPWTDGIGYHWLDRQTREADLAYMVEKLGVTHVFVGAKEESWRLWGTPWFRETFQLERRVSGYTAYVLRESPP